MQPRAKSIDGVARRPQVAAPPALAPPMAAHKPAPAPQRRTFTAPPALTPRRRWWHKLLFPLAIVLCLCASFLVQSLPMGMAAIAVYAVVAWLRRFPSRYSFGLAFLSLATVVVLLVVRQNVDLASNFATYTFLFIVVGTVSSTLESRANLKRRSKILHLRR